MLHIHSKRQNETMKIVSKWTELENIVLSKVTQTQKEKKMFFLIYGLSSNPLELSVQHEETTETRNI